MKKLVKCRNCKTSKIDKLFSLGRLSYTGKFPKKRKINIKKAELGLVKCSKCNLVQLNTNFNLNYLYGPDYGYRTGINKTMLNIDSAKASIAGPNNIYVTHVRYGDELFSVLLKINQENSATIEKIFNQKYHRLIPDSKLIIGGIPERKTEIRRMKADTKKMKKI